MPGNVSPLKADLGEILQNIPASDRGFYVSPYWPLLQFSVGKMDVSELRSHLFDYCKSYNRPNLPSSFMANLSGKCSRIPAGELDVIVSTLGHLPSVTRYLFAKFAVSKAAFQMKNIVRLPLSHRLKQMLDDSVLMSGIVEKLTAELHRWRESDQNRLYKANVIYTRLPGLSVFSIDRFESAHSRSLPETSLVYIVDGLPSMFIVPLTLPMNVLLDSLQTVFASRVTSRSTADSKIPLAAVIVKEASKYKKIRSDFPDHLKKLLGFETDPLNLGPAEPGMEKYPADKCCPFDSVSFELVDGLFLDIKARKNENLLSVLCAHEMAKKINLPANVIQDLSSGVKNAFKPFELGPPIDLHLDDTDESN